MLFLPCCDRPHLHTIRTRAGLRAAPDDLTAVVGIGFKIDGDVVAGAFELDGRLVLNSGSESTGITASAGRRGCCGGDGWLARREIFSGKLYQEQPVVGVLE